MAQFDRIDLMNFVKYGNDFDDQWDEIRNYIRSNASAQREIEEIKRTLPQSSPAGRKRPEPGFSQTSRTPAPTQTSQEEGNTAPGSDPKKWWSKLLGDE
jgi:hypothetical protein